MFKDGSVYEGLTKNNKFNGKGRLTHANGDYYIGQWQDGVANGYGIFVDKKGGSIYDGNWKNDKYDGYGIETWNHNSIIY